MLEQSQISTVIDAQKEAFLDKADELERDLLPHIPIAESFASIITGIRRCGKSTLLLQVLKKHYKEAIYLNFEDVRMVNFELQDFTRLQKEAKDRNINVLFLDEIQMVEGWEIFIHQALREGYIIFITGSNASLLSRELGTHLTGRHLSTELFPFSYSEYIKFKGLTYNAESVKSYLSTGGLPEYVKTENNLILNKLLDDILVRDIAIRHNVRDVTSLKQLAVYLISNIGVPVSANKLNGLFGIKSATTLLEYFSYFKDAYLLEFIPQFSYSLKTQARNPKKVYAIDNGLITATSTSFTENYGRRLENLVYMHLRRHFKEIYSYNEQGECDFIAFEKNKAMQAVQVCYELDERNFKREYDGLIEAMKFFDLKEGIIVTLNKEDLFQENDERVIRVVPAFKYLNTLK